ncbi:uncharacterized protein CELE_T28D9.11 [Caenorhabditis elegans]|uniref:Uncharacterized protein T28D9.11 n=1 Tax=Caenorhabditis elegans TaxID=6239 RepID=YSXB_CAEEL|nr:Uncharacterized protein CELE_T28D9.11 [Caenorhabditis elegans]Q10027.2 RecName: Full=Uncharacterized protein T28D9.11 [Caenorhabditis elegans]CCD72710.1 Uncharacterized protein CELE_T28D9.11 [Caenorhabditis elegans]|eukprot:NP_495311.2 Uncharacterized protein CELE_T28D9.11 [Caenorhabditis elegans]
MRRGGEPQCDGREFRIASSPAREREDDNETAPPQTSAAQEPLVDCFLGTVPNSCFVRCELI